jgi:hypothetical protein
MGFFLPERFSNLLNSAFEELIFLKVVGDALRAKHFYLNPKQLKSSPVLIF